MNLRSFGGLPLALWCAGALALDVVAEAEAPIINDDLTLARQIAIRRAMATAVEQETSVVHSTTLSTSSGVDTRTTLTPQGRALGARILSEHIVRGRLRLSAEVTLAEPGRAEICNSQPKRKVVVTAFPLLRPEQLRYGQYTGWPRTTAEELTRLINGRGKMISTAMPGHYPFVTAESAPSAEHKNGIPLPLIWAGKERAQYVVAGIFRDFGTATQALIIPERQMVIEAYIYDGISGELVARREFAHQLNFSWSIPKSLVPGTKGFRESRLGELFYELLDEVGQWAESSIGCMPFSTRVIRADNRQIYLDIGSDSGITPGQELILTQISAPVNTAAGDLLVGERSAVAGAIVTQVHSRYSVAEITAKKNVPTVRVGDVLFGL